MIPKRKLRITKSIIRGEEWFRVEQLIPNTDNDWLPLGRLESGDLYRTPIVYSSEAGAKGALDRIVKHYMVIDTPASNAWNESEVILEVEA